MERLVYWQVVEPVSMGVVNMGRRCYGWLNYLGGRDCWLSHLSCSHLSISKHLISEQVNSVGDWDSVLHNVFPQYSSGVSEREVSLMDFRGEWLWEFPLFGVVLNGIDNILDHVSFIGACP